MESLLLLISSAVLNGAPLMYGTLGEILTEKSGNLNLGVEGLMFMGGAFGLGAAFYYEKMAGVAAVPMIGVLLAVAAAFLVGCLGSLIFAFLTTTLRVNQNVTGLALAMFGTGVGQFVGELMRVREGGFVAVSNNMKLAFQSSPFPQALQNIPVVGSLLFGYNIFVYAGVIIAVIMHIFLNKTRTGLNLRAVGENPGTADAAGINPVKYKYIATVIGGGISALGGMVFIMTIAGCVWNHAGLSGEGWLAVALVIFCLWRPLNTIWGSVLFGALMILYLRLSVEFIPTQLYKMLPYVVTIIVLIITSTRNRKEDQPPAALGIPYFRENR